VTAPAALGRLASQVREEAGTLTFEMTDDGAGFDATGRRLGARLLNMADRLGAFGGRLRVDSAPRQGTHVTGMVPLPASLDAIADDYLRPNASCLPC
jgi:signal transduction histidine kinase